eukprot:Lithocolla_globosa_v1_NODE_4252_length_1478_cov_12.404779.p1 type:complete len:192 gc:universal NODE_4252_length_1478_cov_12.404779:1425-850(-)
MPQLSDHQKILIQVQYKELKINSPNLNIKSLAYIVRKNLNPADFNGRRPDYKTVIRWIKRLEDNDGYFCQETHYKGNKNAQKADQAVDEKIKQRLLKKPSLRDAVCFEYFNEQKNKKVSFKSQSSIMNSRKRTLDVSSPKNDQIVFTPHHKRMRLDKAEMEITKGDWHFISKEICDYVLEDVQYPAKFEGI